MEEDRRQYDSNGFRAIIREEARAAIDDWSKAQETIPCYKRCDRVSEIEKDCALFHHTMFGGDSHGGIVSRLNSLDTRMKIVMGVISAIGLAVIGIVVEMILSAPT